MSIGVPLTSAAFPGARMRRAPFVGKILFVFLLLCLTFWTQSSALTSRDGPHHSPDHCCPLCNVGLLPVLQPATTSAVAPVFHLIWLAPTPDSGPVHDVLVAAGSSRAPPSA
jgi:hypothetical protein